MLLMTKSFKVVKGTAVAGAEIRKMTSLYDDGVLLIRPVEPREAEPPAVKDWGPSKWSSIASSVPGRSGKQCRERWNDHLNPSIFKGKSVVIRLGESSFSPTSPKASSRKKKLDSPVTDLQNSRKKRVKHTHTTTPVENVTFDFGDHYDGCTDDALGVDPLLLCDVGSVLAQIMDMNDSLESVAPVCLTEEVDHEIVEKRGAKAKRNLCAKLTNPPDDEEADWRIMSTIAGFYTEDDEEEVKKPSGGITFRTVKVVSKIPTAHKRFVSTPFDTIMDPMKKTDMPAFQFVNKMMMTPPKNTPRSTL